MSGHRRVKDISYEGDGFDDYDEEEYDGDGGQEGTVSLFVPD